MSPSVLVPLAAGFEETEMIAPVDLLRRAGARVVLAAVGEELNVTGRNAVTIRADTGLAAALGEDFDCVFLPGGPGVKQLRADARIAALVRRQHAAGRWLAAICAAPALLHDAGLLAGRRFTAHFSVAPEVPGILLAERTVVDGRLLTSRGAGTAVDFGLLLVEMLFSPEISAEIARSICA
jgi:4-methyl-5(b-hydroxyethyl)-thiazole monophosphate biosynthesis